MMAESSILSVSLPPLLQKFYPIQSCQMIVTQKHLVVRSAVVQGRLQLIRELVDRQIDYCCEGWENIKIGVHDYMGRTHKCSVFNGRGNSTYLTTDQYDAFMSSLSSLRANFKFLKSSFDALTVLQRLKVKADVLKSKLMEQRRRLEFLLENVNSTTVAPAQ